MYDYVTIYNPLMLLLHLQVQVVLDQQEHLVPHLTLDLHLLLMVPILFVLYVVMVVNIYLVRMKSHCLSE